MSGQKQIREMFRQYGAMVDEELLGIFQSAPSYEMYKHMSYFMGFSNEKLEKESVYGGKRFRSSLALMLGECYGVLLETVPAAVSLELFHNFTLIHDDIVDGDVMRRGRPTVWKLFGRDHAINDGDAQLLLSLQPILESQIISAEQKVSLQSFLIKQYLKVSEGQYLDFTLTSFSLGDNFVKESTYMEMIGRKTADLIAASTSVAGLLAGVSKEEQEYLFTYGYRIGVAYQLCDDMVSIWGTSEQTGKRVYGDILECKKTLPILWLYNNAAEGDKEKMQNLYEGDMSEEKAAEVLAMLDKAGAYEVMMSRVREESAVAMVAISKLSISSEQKKELSQVVDALLIDIKNV